MTTRYLSIYHIFKFNSSFHKNLLNSNQIGLVARYQKQVPDFYSRRLFSISCRSFTTSTSIFKKMGTPEETAPPVEGEVVKSASQLKKDAKRLAKMEKFNKKKDQQKPVINEVNIKVLLLLV